MFLILRHGLQLSSTTLIINHNRNDSVINKISFYINALHRDPRIDYGRHRGSKYCRYNRTYNGIDKWNDDDDRRWVESFRGGDGNFNGRRKYKRGINK